MTGALHTARGGKLVLESLDERQVTALTSDPSPPGSSLRVECDAGSFSIKVVSCRRVTDGEAVFRIQGRPVNLNRRVREELMGRLD